MGNVNAAGPAKAGSTDIPAPPLATPPPSPTAAPPPSESPSQPSQPILPNGEDGLNPGTYEDLHKKCKDVFPQIFDGGKLIVSKGLSSHFQVSHTVTLSSVQPSGYRFGATYVGMKQISPSEAYPVMMADVDPSGNLNANIIHAFSESIRTKMVAQIQNSKCVATQGSLDYRGRNFTASTTLCNIDVLNSSGIAVAQYLQRVTPRLDLGAELLYQYGPQVPGNEVSILSLASRLKGKSWQFSGTASPLGGNLHLCYSHKVTESVTVAAELETNMRMGESVATVGYQIEIPNANVTFRGQMDTNWCVGAVMEKKLQPFPFVFALSGFANHVKAQYRFGVGLIVG